jgi:exopolysaccharide biosynthesis predicted pyruvyltransferase EpsI
VIGTDIEGILKQKVKPRFIKSFFGVIITRSLKDPNFDFGISLKSSLTHWITRAKLKFRTSRKQLNAFRTDVEKTDIELPADNVDLSAELELSSCDPEIATYTAKLLLTELDKYEVVRTNRLHVAIGAMLLGKKVELHGNNYYKIRAVYEYSIKGTFTNVKWFD